MSATPPFIHPTADVSPQATIGHGTKIWHQAQIREDARIGPNCIISKGVYVDFGVSIGANSKLQNGVYVYHGATIEDGVFLGPGVILTNDKLPRAINPDGSLKSDADWQVSPIHIKRGASIGAGSVVLPGIVAVINSEYVTFFPEAIVVPVVVITGSGPAYLVAMLAKIVKLAIEPRKKNRSAAA